MKKVFLLFALGFAMMAYASTYNYLVFTSQTGTTTVFTISNLTINVSGNELSVTNNDGTVNLVLTNLVSMQFSKDKTITSLENVINAVTGCRGRQPLRALRLFSRQTNDTSDVGQDSKRSQNGLKMGVVIP